jgi:hypothetical protein
LPEYEALTIQWALAALTFGLTSTISSLSVVRAERACALSAKTPRLHSGAVRVERQLMNAPRAGAVIPRKLLIE